MPTQPTRVAVLVDGFNLYHSLVQTIEEDGADVSIKWLNIKALCQSQIGTLNDTNAILTHFYYFTSLAAHVGQDTVVRHKSFIKALEYTGFNIVQGEFKSKNVDCRADCKKPYTIHTEKKTDVNLAVKLLELFYLNTCDACLILSGDGDLFTAIETAQRLFPSKKVGILFPNRRNHRGLARVANHHQLLTPQDYLGNRFPTRVFRGPSMEDPAVAPKLWRGAFLKG